MASKISRILLHVGYHKTGSSWLQKHLFTSSSPVFEPLGLRMRGTGPVANCFYRDPLDQVPNAFDFETDWIEREIDEIADGNEAFAAKYPVLSNERLSGNPHSGGFDAKRVSELLHKVFPEGRVMIVVREQKDFLLSNYIQYLSVGGTDGLQRYLAGRYDSKRPFFSPHHINYVPLVKAYQRLFGPERVLVLPYELFVEEPAVFVNRIGRLIDRDLTIDPARFAWKSNLKRCPWRMYNLRFLNPCLRASSVNGYSRWANPITRTSAKVFSSVVDPLIPAAFSQRLKSKLANEIAAWTADRYAAANAELSGLMDCDLTQYGYDVQGAEPDSAQAETA